MWRFSAETEMAKYILFWMYNKEKDTFDTGLWSWEKTCLYHKSFELGKLTSNLGHILKVFVFQEMETIKSSPTGQNQHRWHDCGLPKNPICPSGMEPLWSLRGCDKRGQENRKYQKSRIPDTEQCTLDMIHRINS